MAPLKYIAPQGAPSTHEGTIGFNLQKPTYWARDLAFADGMAMAGSWQIQELGGKVWQPHPDHTAGGVLVPLYTSGGGEGYPDFTDPEFTAGRKALAYLYTGQEGELPAGKYKLEYTGTATIKLLGGGIVFVSSDAEGKLYNMPATGSRNQLVLVVEANDDGDRLDAVHVRLPDLETDPTGDTPYTSGGPVFRPEFLDAFAALVPAGKTPWLRLMDWSGAWNVVASPYGSWCAWEPVWTERITTSSIRQSEDESMRRSGVAIETAVSLANEFQARIGRGVVIYWTAPHQEYVEIYEEEPPYPVEAELYSDYCRGVATIFRDTMHADNRLGLAHSNEVWNPGQRPSRWISSLVDGKSNLHPDYQAMVGDKAIECFDHFIDIFEETGQRAQLLLILEGWRPQIGYLTGVLDRIDEVKGAGWISANVYGAGSSAYITPRPNVMATWDANTDPEEIVAELDYSHRTYNIPFLSAHAALVRSYGLRVVDYEGGNHANWINLWRGPGKAAQSLASMYPLHQMFFDDVFRHPDIETDVLTLYAYMGTPDSHNCFYFREAEGQVASDPLGSGAQPKFDALIWALGELP